MTILGPVIFAGFFALMFYFASVGDTEVRTIAVVDSSGIFIKKIPDTKYVRFEYLFTKVSTIKKILNKTDYYGILYISPIVSYSPKAVQLYSYQHLGLNIIQHIQNSIEKEIRNQKLKAYNIDNIDNILKSVETKIDIETVQISATGEEKKTDRDLSMWVGYVSSLVIYMFILMYGVQVMRGVLEEKTNRIVEIVISSVKPFQLMMGKVFGVALAAISQFIVWVVLSIVFISIIKAIFIPDLSSAYLTSHPNNLMEVSKTAVQVQQPVAQINPELANAMSILDSIDFYVIIGAFLFYFIGGYLLYSSLFAAVGAAVDNESDTQQFVFPITLPLIIGIIVMVNAFQNPDSSVAFWFSMIPFTSPIVMMARIAYHVPVEQVVISMLILIASFLFTIWMAGKIYKTGILMYGKKVNIRELIKWIRYKG
jgi:ABC-2 type transport system permease protein